jgi:DNA-binding FadR family transcriptional regulator
MLEQPAADGRLPTERDLSRQLGVTRHALRRELQQLEADGKLWRHVGRGTYAGTRPAPPAPPLALAQHGTPAELLEARRMIEPPLAAAAALHASNAAIRRIQDACRRCAAARSTDDYEIWDEALHRAIAAASGNSIMVGLYEALNQARREIVLGLFRRSTILIERREINARQHEAIVAAIAERDAEGAWKHMRAHIDAMAETYARLAPAAPDGSNREHGA